MRSGRAPIVSGIVAVQGAVALLIAALVPVRTEARPTSQPATEALDAAHVAEAFARAEALPRLHALVIARHGKVRAERRFRGPSLDTPVNVKSISKSLMSILVGIAIDRGVLRGTDQAVAPFFPEYARRIDDPRFARLRIGDLLSMRSGLTRTSGEGYGAWVKSRNWLAHVLLSPMTAEPGEAMTYSTGNTHVLSAILTRASGQSTHAFARTALAEPLGITLPRWERDPQGIFVGGNQMRLSAHALVRIGELYRNGGRHEGEQVVSEAWVRESLTPRTRSLFSGQLYGYGWFVSEVEGHPMFFAWGYGGQFIFVVPDLALTVVTTSATRGARDFDHLWAIQGILADCIVKAAEQADAGSG